MAELVFRIRGMDCAEEVGVLRRELEPLMSGGDCGLAAESERLRFDLVGGKMIVVDSDDAHLADRVIEAVRRTGMSAILVSRGGTPVGEPTEDSFWEMRGRLLLCVASGVLAFVGLAWHAWAHGGWIEALTSGAGDGGEGAGEHVYPSLSIVLALGAIASGGWYIAPKAWFALRRFRPDMHLLMTLAVFGAIGIGEWFEASMVTFLFAVALQLETWSVHRARRAIGSLVALSPRTARCRADGREDWQEIDVDEITVGSTVLVRPGEKVALDGEITQGESALDQASITGESIPVAKGPGDEVYAGSINGQGALEFRVTKLAADSTLARIIRMVEEAQSRRAPVQQWVDRFAHYYTPAMMGLAALTATVPALLLGATWGESFYNGLVLLVIACPCALVISTPVSIVAGLTTAARGGVLIKGGAYLEAPAKLGAVALDKTGTVTYGRPRVREVIALNGHTEEELLARAAALERNSLHPLAKAIVEEARARGIEPEAAAEFREVLGKGAEGKIGGHRYWIGSHRFVQEELAGDGRAENEAGDDDFGAIAKKLEDSGHSVVAVGNERHICGVLSIADGIREGAADAVRELKHLGVGEVAMLTGDNRRAAEEAAKAAGIDTALAELLPEDKVKAVEELRRRYGTVAMVGDGVNDAPAMAAATVGIAMGAIGSDAALETADIALMSDDLTLLPWLVGHSRRTRRIIQENIGFALGLKAVFIGLTFAGLATLWMAIAADMGASLLVIFNALRLLRDGARD